MNHVSVDLETLGTVADAVILSIGAVRFDPDTNQIDDGGFYRCISIDSNLDYKRRIQEDTLVWWMKQSPAAQKVFHEPNKVSLETALCEFSDWLGGTDSFLWGNGADFDQPMLALAYTQTTVPIPWKFWNIRCLRTLKNLPAAKNVTVPRLGTHHNALQDAIYQAQLIQAIFAAMAAQGKAKVKT